MYTGPTCSFCSVSCLRDVERDSRVSPLATCEDGAPFKELRRVTVELREEGTRGEAAERAVTPRAMEGEGGVGEGDCGVRLETGGVTLEGAVEATMVESRERINRRRSRC
jgi:hypothetical protein